MKRFKFGKVLASVLALSLVFQVMTPIAWADDDAASSAPPAISTEAPPAPPADAPADAPAERPAPPADAEAPAEEPATEAPATDAAVAGIASNGFEIASTENVTTVALRGTGYADDNGYNYQETYEAAGITWDGDTENGYTLTVDEAKFLAWYNGGVNSDIDDLCTTNPANYVFIGFEFTGDTIDYVDSDEDDNIRYIAVYNTEDGFYYSGKTDYTYTVVYTDETTEDITITRVLDAIDTTTSVSLRCDGYADDLKFDYDGTYAAAGITFDEDTYTLTVDEAKFATWYASASATDEVVDALRGEGDYANYLFVGIEFEGDSITGVDSDEYVDFIRYIAVYNTVDGFYYAEDGYTGSSTFSYTVEYAGVKELEIDITRDFVAAETATSVALRPVGMHDDAGFNYAETYAKAGITFENNTITVDEAKFASWYGDLDNTSDIAALTGEIEEVDYIFVGLEFSDTNLKIDDVTIGGESEFDTEGISYIAVYNPTEAGGEFLADKTFDCVVSYEGLATTSEVTISRDFVEATTATSVAFRKPGVEGDTAGGIGYEYAAVYDEAGITLSNGTILIDEATFADWYAETTTNADAISAMTGTEEGYTGYLFVGLEFSDETLTIADVKYNESSEFDEEGISYIAVYDKTNGAFLADKAYAFTVSYVGLTTTTEVTITRLGTTADVIELVEEVSDFLYDNDSEEIANNSTLLDELLTLEDEFLTEFGNVSVDVPDPTYDGSLTTEDQIKGVSAPEGLAIAYYGDGSYSEDLVDTVVLSLDVDQIAAAGDVDFAFEAVPTVSVGDGAVTEISNADLNAPVTFKVYLPSTFEGTYAKVEHVKSNNEGTEYFTLPVLTDEGGDKYIQITVTGFSSFYVTSYTPSSSSSKSYYIKATATGNGTVAPEDEDVSPDSMYKVSKLSDVTFEFDADSGYEVTDVIVNGDSVGACDEYEFEDIIITMQTLEVVFEKSSSSSSSSSDDDDEEEDDDADEIELPFGDVDEDDDNLEGIAYVYDNGIMAGISSDVFGGEMSITRAMIAAILYRVNGSEPVDAEMAFADVADGQYYYDAVVWGKDAGIMAGMSETEFAPNAAITQEQFIAFLYRYASVLDMDMTVEYSADMSDFVMSDYAITAVAWALENDIIDDDFEPMAEALRGDVATALMNFMEMM